MRPTPINLFPSSLRPRIHGASQNVHTGHEGRLFSCSAGYFPAVDLVDVPSGLFPPPLSVMDTHGSAVDHGMFTEKIPLGASHLTPEQTRV